MRPSLRLRLAEHLDHLVALGRPQARHDLVEEQQLGRVASARATSSRLRSGRVSEEAGRSRLGASLSCSRIERAMRARAVATLRSLQEGADDDVVEHRKPGERLHDLERAADARGADLVRAQAVDRACR